MILDIEKLFQSQNLQIEHTSQQPKLKCSLSTTSSNLISLCLTGFWVCTLFIVFTKWILTKHNIFDKTEDFVKTLLPVINHVRYRVSQKNLIAGIPGTVYMRGDL